MVHPGRPHSVSSFDGGEAKLTRRFRRAMEKGVKRLSRQHSEDSVSSGSQVPLRISLRREQKRQEEVDERNLQRLRAMAAPPYPAQTNVRSQVSIRVDVEVSGSTIYMLLN